MANSNDRTVPWDWLGAPLALDFANSVRRRGHTYEELFLSAADVASWSRRESERVPVVDAQTVAPQLDEIRAFRDDVFLVLNSVATRSSLPATAAKRLNSRVRAYPVVAQLKMESGAPATQVLGAPGPLDDLLARVADATIRLVGDTDSGLALCDAPSCGQFFIRARRNQRWCGPACGNRARVARHAHV